MMILQHRVVIVPYSGAMLDFNEKGICASWMVCVVAQRSDKERQSIQRFDIVLDSDRA